jgi:hypothetical protein
MSVILDGELFITCEITFKVLPGAVKIVVPEGLAFVKVKERDWRNNEEQGTEEDNGGDSL